MRQGAQTDARGGGPAKVRLPGAAPRSELALRLISGLVMAALALALTWGGGWWFAALVGAGAAVLGWEWGRLVRGVSFDALAGLHMAVGVAATAFATAGALLWGLAIVALGALAALALRRATGGGGWFSALGFPYTGLPAIALVWLRSDETFGLAAVLFLFAVVWTSDSMAYATGRLIGGPKLWPRVSPGKTWAGLAGGTASSALMAFAFALALGGPASALALALVGLLLALVSQGGDLVESALKRKFGIKDASGLIPGHGGLLDRVDGLVLAALAAAVLALAVDPGQPGAALLVWN